MRVVENVDVGLGIISFKFNVIAMTKLNNIGVGNGLISFIFNSIATTKLRKIVMMMMI